MRVPARDAVLVTGVSGVLGAEVAARLLAQDRPVVGLLHNRSEVRLNNGSVLFGGGMPQHHGLTVVRGSLGAPEFGIPAADYRRLLTSVGAVIHCGAVTRFDLPKSAYYETNVAGTEEVLKFCGLCDAEIDLVHVSTAFVVGAGRDFAGEQHVDGFEPDSTNFYEESKYQGELVLHRYGLIRRAVVVRPSIITGDEKSGRIRDFDNFYVAVKAATSGHVFSIPGDYAASLNLVPVDYVAKIIVAALASAEKLYGSVVHAVSRRALTMRDFSDVLAEYPELYVPRFVSAESFAAAERGLLERRVYDATLRNYEPYFNRHVDFAVENSFKIVGRVPSGGRPYLRRVLDYALGARYLGSRKERQAVAT